MKIPSVALVQRSIPHYRIPLFRELSADVRYDWTFFCGDHDPRQNSGLAAPLKGLRQRPLRQQRLAGPLLWQSGVTVDPSAFRAIVVDYGWTILSNPVRFARAHRLGVATIGWSKGMAQNLGKSKSNVRRHFESSSISLCDALIVYGQISKEYFLDLGLPSERIFVAQNTIDTEQIAIRWENARMAGWSLRERLGLDCRPVIGFLGKIGPEKRVDLLIAAFERAVNHGMDGQMLVAGLGPSAAEIDARIARSPHRNRIVRLTDVSPGAEDGVFQAMDVYVSYAQAGLGVLEAMAHGIPIVATPERFPETELLTDNDTAFLSSEASVDSLADRLAEAIAGPETRRAIADRARDKVLKNATLKGMVNSICDAVTFALERRATSIQRQTRSCRARFFLHSD